jgi:xanthine dehydrogenase small subunit
MTGIRNEIRFLLNDAPIAITDAGASRTLLDFLRLERRLTGTKEGCAEGDCGACTVLVGRLVDAAPVYETVNACIRFIGSLDGCHVVTVEHLKGRDGSLHPVQQALVDHHGSQCGFCTPGIVMSLYDLWTRNPAPGDDDIEQALQGNLCRCTGYAPILRAARAASAGSGAFRNRLAAERREVAARLEALADGNRVECGPEGDRIIVPADVDDLAEVLLAHPGATIVAGSTDVGLWVTKLMRGISPAVFIGNIAALQAIEVSDGLIRIGAGVSYSRFTEVIAARLPQMREFWLRIGGTQIRNMGTIGGNLANGSPIGDTPPPLIALGATIRLRRGAERRSLRLEDFFIDYGRQDRRPGEFVEGVDIPLPRADDRFAVYKISKRRDEDISTVSAGLRVRLDGAGTVTDAVIAFGGMAATPKRARRAEKALVGNAFSSAAIEAAVEALGGDFRPISDWRASAEYRMQVAGNLMRRFWLENGNGGTRETARLAGTVR